MSKDDIYKAALPEGKTLCVFEGGRLIFSSGGKWLYPLFDFEAFMASYKGEKSDLRAHDTAVGKAAAVLMLKAGIRHIHAELSSSLAVEFFENVNKKRLEADKIVFTYNKLIPRLMCKTEMELESMKDDDINAMYNALAKRIECSKR